jgi:membrane-associated HD superfamily phosphohydrolase
MFVSEDIIDEIVLELEAADFEQEVAIMGEKQPVLLGYVLSEDFELLTNDERDWLLYLVLVLWKSIEKVYDNAEQIRKEDLEAADEANWERLEHVTAKRFRDRMTTFFEGYKQEDLLAFVEDNLTEDEEDTENVVTKEGREPMFVALKSVIDALTK